jgi:hypothetical protein
LFFELAIGRGDMMIGLSRGIVKQAMAADFGMIEMMDQEIGKVICEPAVYSLATLFYASRAI